MVFFAEGNAGYSTLPGPASLTRPVIRIHPSRAKTASCPLSRIGRRWGGTRFCAQVFQALRVEGYRCDTQQIEDSVTVANVTGGQHANLVASYREPGKAIEKGRCNQRTDRRHRKHEF